MQELSLNDVFKILKKRKSESNKGDYGTLLNICGSAYYRGAAQLSSLGALRTGVGILRVASTERVIAPLCSNIPEAVFLPLPEGERGEIDGFDAKSYFKDFPKTNAVLCGCGLTTFGNTPRLVSDLTENAPCPIVLDADALNCVSDDTDILLKAKSEIVITPHIGEFARLCGVGASDISSDPVKYGEEFTRRYRVVLVLKSNITRIFSGNGMFVSRYGNPGLARGGSGDILAGMTASFMAQGYSAADAAKAAVVLHGAAADMTAKRLSMQGMLPHDIIYDLCEIFKKEGY